jgi:cytochrome c556
LAQAAASGRPLTADVKRTLLQQLTAGKVRSVMDSDERELRDSIIREMLGTANSMGLTVQDLRGFNAAQLAAVAAILHSQQQHEEHAAALGAGASAAHAESGPSHSSSSSVQGAVYVQHSARAASRPGPADEVDRKLIQALMKSTGMAEEEVRQILKEEEQDKHRRR